MSIGNGLWGRRGFGNLRSHSTARKRPRRVSCAAFEALENRLVLSAPPLPVIPTGTGHLFVVTSSPYNAKGDGTTNNTTAFQDAINDASAAGGGVVEVPAASADYEVGALTMASNVDLQVDSGATVQAVSGLSGSVWITVSNCNNWEISGLGSGSTMGALDGHGNGSSGSLNMINLSGATVGLIQNIQVNNSLHEHIQCGAVLDNDITINGVSINTPSSTSNTDGIDPSGSNWLIENCTISDGDDDIAVKPESIACTNIDIENCTILAGHGISVGGETQAGLNGLTVNNCTFNGTTNGIHLKAGEGNGGMCTNMTFSNITMTNVTNPIVIDSYYNNGDNNYPTDPTADKGSPPDSLTPIWENLTFSNFTSTDSSGNAGIIFGLPDEPVLNMQFDNVNITSDKGMEIDHVRNVTFDSKSHITTMNKNVDLVGETSGSSFPTPVDAGIAAAGFTNAAVGSPTVPFDTSPVLYDPDTGDWTVAGVGGNISGTSDQFSETYQSVSGNSSVTAELTALTSPGGSAVPQAGVMYRLGTGATDPFAAVVQTTGNQVIFEWRATAGGAVQTSTPVSETVGTIDVRVTRSGSSFTGFFSTNGTTYTQIGSAETISAIGTSADAGLAVTANDNGATASASFANVAISGGSTNQPPTVATPASATPNPVTAKTTALSVLGADDGGEANLTYTWAVTSGPTGVTFSANGTNASKASTATFTQAGAYTFTVTITDSGGLTTTSSTNVTVSQTATSITVSPATASVADNGTQQFTASEKDQFGNSMSTQPSFTWSLASGSVGTISTSGLYTAPASGTGSATVHAVAGSITGTAAVTVTATNQPPTVATPASATPNPVTAKTTALSVLGADDGGEANLTYTWAVTSGPTGVTFSANGTNASKASTATFTTAGAYTFTVTIKDSGGLTTTSSVNVTVNQTLTTIVLSPSSASVSTGGTQQFTASGKDQFGNTLTTQPTFTWSVASGGVGSISTSGLYSAGSTAGSATVQATSAGITGTAAVTVTATNQPPTVATPASATPNPVTAKTTALSVLGADDGGEANLTYTWAVTSGPTGVTFSANGTNASKASTATFTQAGAYTFTVTIKDTGGLTATSSVNVTVNQTLTTIALSPTSASVATGGTQQFTASAKDQFGNSLTTQPTFTWSVASGGVGTISSSGLYTAGTTAGSATVQATSGSVTGTASVTVTASTVTHVNLAANFNAIGFANDGQTFTGGGIDGKGDAYSATLIAASNLESKYSFGTAGVNDVVTAANQTITLPAGKFSTLSFLGTATNGKKTGRTFVVHYTDGTSTTFTISLSNWDSPQNFAGETVALQMSYFDTSTGGKTTSTVDLYEYTLDLNNTKTVASITMPGTTQTIVVMAMNLNP